MVADAESFALRQVQAMAAHHQRVMDDACLLLMPLANSSAVRSLDSEVCANLLTDILDGNAISSSLNAISTIIKKKSN